MEHTLKQATDGLFRQSETMQETIAKIREELAEVKRIAIVIRDERDSLMEAARVLLRAIDRNEVMVVSADGHPDHPLREVIAAIEKRLCE